MLLHCMQAEAHPAVASDDSAPGLSAQEERELRLEHAMDALKLDVSLLLDSLSL